MGTTGICTFYITNVISVFVREGYNILCYRLATIFELVQNQRTIIRQYPYVTITLCKKAGKKADEKSPRVSFFRIYYFTKEEKRPYFVESTGIDNKRLISNATLESTIKCFERTIRKLM